MEANKTKITYIMDILTKKGGLMEEKDQIVTFKVNATAQKASHLIFGCDKIKRKPHPMSK